MTEFPGVHFKYSTKDVKPYYYSISHLSTINEDNAGIKLTKYK